MILLELRVSEMLRSLRAGNKTDEFCIILPKFTHVVIPLEPKGIREFFCDSPEFEYRVFI